MARPKGGETKKDGEGNRFPFSEVKNDDRSQAFAILKTRGDLYEF